MCLPLSFFTDVNKIVNKPIRKCESIYENCESSYSEEASLYYIYCLNIFETVLKMLRVDVLKAE